MSAAAALLDLYRAHGIKLATAESCTGGMVGAWLTEVPGSSDVFERGFITYSNAAKQDMLGVTLESLSAHGAVSKQVAAEMASGALARSQADIAVSITGIAGPGGSEHKPEGRVCFGLAYGDIVHVETQEFGSIGRDKVRNAAAKRALELLTQGAESRSAQT